MADNRSGMYRILHLSPTSVPLIVLLVSIAFLLLNPPGVSASSAEYLEGEFWVELEPFVSAEGDEYPLSRETALRRLLEEARYSFSGMVYGFTFEYVPSDRSRQVEERFVLRPLAEIPWGDRALKVRETRVQDTRLYARIRYDLAEFQVLRLAGWDSNTIPVDRGEGRKNLFLGYREKLRAVEDAVRNGILGHLRARHFNRPREAKGDVLLTAVPRVSIREGAYEAVVGIRLVVRDLEPYRLF